MGVSAVEWHDLECGSYAADLPLWRELAGPPPRDVLDLGAGTGRVAFALAGEGHRVVAVEADHELHGALSDRAPAGVRPVLGDARELELEERFDLVVVAMQTVQIMGGAPGRARLLERIRAHLRPGGIAGLAIVERLGTFEDPGSPPQHAQHGELLLSSAATAVRRVADGYELELRRRSRAGGGPEHDLGTERIVIDRLSARTLGAEGRRAGLREHAARSVPATAEHSGSTVVILGV